MPKFSRKPNHAIARNTTRGKVRKSTAQAMVEFVLALPIVLLVVYGLIEAGRLVFIYASVVSAARQAVRYGSTTGMDSSGTAHYNDCPGILAAANKLAFLNRFSNISISYDNGPDVEPAELWTDPNCGITDPAHPTNGDRIHATVAAVYDPIFPFLPFAHKVISSSSTRTLLVGVSIPVNVTPIVSTPGTTGIIYLQKGCTPDADVGLGQTIHYTYEIINQGTGPVSSISLTDSPMPESGIDCSGISDPLAGGGQASCTSSHVTTQADMDAGFLTNTATVNAQSGGGPVQPASSTCTVDFDSRAELTLTKSGTAPSTTAVGQLVTYVFTLRNTGTVTLTSPYAISDARIGANWSCSSAVSPLGVGASTTCTGTYALTSGDITLGTVTNTATATAKYGTTTVTSNQATTTVPVPRLLLELSASPVSVSALGQTITYTYKLTNRTNSSMSGITVTDTRGATNYSCPGTLAAHATTNCTRTSTSYTQADMDAGVITNQATATAAGPITSNSATTSVSVTQTPLVQLIKTASPSAPTSPATAFTLPQNITYTYTLKNIGNVTLGPPYAVTDDKLTVSCSGATGTIAPNATTTCTNVTYPLTQADLDAGFVINHASGSAMRGANNIISAQTSATVITYTLARLSLVKSSNPTFFSGAGNQITYSYSLKNTGGVSVRLSSTYTLMDDKLGAITCPGGTTLGLGASVNCTTTPIHVVTGAEATAGAIINNVVPTGGVTTPSAATPFATLRVPQFICNGSRLKHLNPTPIPAGSDVLWTLVNNTGIPVHISAAYISWNAAPPTLTQVLLGGTSIWNGPASSSYGGFFVPGSPWTLPLGNTIMQLRFSASASNIRVILSFSEAGCGTVDSNLTYPD